MENVWLNDNPFGDYGNSSKLESDSDSDSNSECENNYDTHNTAEHSHAAMQTELLSVIVDILGKLTDHIVPQTQQCPTAIQPPQTTIATPTNKWKTVGKCAPYPPHYAQPQNFEHINKYNVLPIECLERDQPPQKLQRAKPATQHPIPPLKQKSRPRVVINQKPERITTWPKTIPGNATYAETVRLGRNVMIYSDSICNRMSKWELNKKSTDAGINCQINKKPFVGATSEDLYTHHMLPTLKNNTPEEVLIHVGINDVKQLADKDGGMTSEVIDIISSNIIKCGQVAKSYGVNYICISAVLPVRGKKYQQTISHINYRVENLCKMEGFNFITNTNIIFAEATPVDEGLYYKDGLHLNVAGRQVLMDNFISYLSMR
jgi:hypothetical protein